MAPACNPSYLEGRDQEDCSLMPTWANSWKDPISVNGWVWWWYVLVIPATQGSTEENCGPG
jgi:hypothetical protein